jgi:hypothetical protein
LPVNAAQSQDRGLQGNFKDQMQAWAMQVDEHRAQAMKDLQSLLSRIEAPSRTAAAQ